MSNVSSTAQISISFLTNVDQLLDLRLAYAVVMIHTLSAGQIRLIQVGPFSFLY